MAQKRATGLMTEAWIEEWSRINHKAWNQWMDWAGRRPSDWWSRHPLSQELAVGQGLLSRMLPQALPTMESSLEWWRGVESLLAESFDAQRRVVDFWQNLLRDAEAPFLEPTAQQLTSMMRIWEASIDNAIRIQKDLSESLAEGISSSPPARKSRVGIAEAVRPDKPSKPVTKD